MRIHYLLLLILPLAVACSTGTTREQAQMCTEIASFAAVAASGQSHAVVLRGGWGGDSPSTLMTHDCQHSGYAPGKALCAYLLPNTSWEFGSDNAKRVAQCLDSGERQDFVRRVDNYEWPVEITSPLALLMDKRIQVTVRLERTVPAAAGLSDLSVLTLSAVCDGN